MRLATAIRAEAAAPQARAQPVLQPKLRIGAIEDPLEREADRVADAIVSGGAAGAVRRKCSECAKEEETLRCKQAGTAVSTGAAAASMATNAVARGGMAMPGDLRRYFEPRFGVDFSGVRFHLGHEAQRASKALQARAFTIGPDIAFGHGEFAPHSLTGRRLIAHEMAHVVQQGRHGPAIQRLPAPASAPVAIGIALTFQRVIDIMCTNATMRDAFAMIDRDGISIVGFRTGFDTWTYDDGRVEEVPIPGLRGNTDIAGRTIRLNERLSAEDMAMTLFHELQHWAHRQDPAGPRGLESEIQARIATEQLAIDRGMPPTRPGYRTADGHVDEAAIRRDMKSSSHYSPTGRRRTGRRYEGEVRVPGPLLCPPIGDFPEPSRERRLA